MGTGANAGPSALSLFKLISTMSVVVLLQIIEWFGVRVSIIVYLDDGQFGLISGAIYKSAHRHV